MSELKQIVSLVIISLLVGAGLILVAGALPGLIEGDLVVSHYDAVLHENGTLAEHYDYVVKNSGQYRMLYRFWEAPLLTTPSDTPNIEFVSLTNPPGTTGLHKGCRFQGNNRRKWRGPGPAGKDPATRRTQRTGSHSSHPILTRGPTRSKRW